MFFFFFQAEDGIRDWSVTGVQTCALPISVILMVSGAAAAAAYLVLTSSVVVSIRSWSFGWLPKKKVSRLPRSFDSAWRSWRSEERRVGKECRVRWAAEHRKEKERMQRTLA